MYWIFAIGGYRRGVPDRVLRVPDRVPGGLRRALRGGARARGRPPRARRAREPGDRRAGGHGGRLPRPRAPHRRARAADADRDGRSWACCRSSPASLQIPGVTAAMEHFLRGHVRGIAPVPASVPSESSAYLGLLGRGDASRSPGSAWPTSATSPGPGRPRACASSFEPGPRLPQEQVVLRRADRRARLPAGDRRRALRNDVVERVVVQGIVDGTVGAVREVGLLVRGGAVRLRPRLRAARDRRLRRARPLLPGGGSS